MSRERAVRLWGYAPKHFFCWRCWRKLPGAERRIVRRLESIEKRYGRTPYLEARFQRVWAAIRRRNRELGPLRVFASSREPNIAAGIAAELGV